MIFINKITKKSLSAIFIFFSSVHGYSTPLDLSLLEYKGAEFDGEWMGEAPPIKGNCRPAKIEIRVNRASIQGDMLWQATPKWPNVIQSKIIGVIHQDNSIDFKLRDLVGGGKTKIVKGQATRKYLQFSEKGGGCPYEITLQKK